MDNPNAYLSTNQGLPLSDNHNSLKAGSRGPTLLEDFILREKLTHFDHERIPERVVHARGAGAHGYFEVYGDESELTRAAFLSDPGRRTPVFARFSTVAGSRGAADTVRDTRGFAVKFYTTEGNYDLVGNNMPVFFIQDAIKFPDLVHALKPEPHHGMPQASSAHDTFWDFATLMPESLHMLMWVMSDRGLPRSLRMMEGFGVHSFRFINARGVSHFVKFHWKPQLGVHALLWDEAQAIAGQDPDFHRRDLWNAIERGDFPQWELGVQVVSEDDLPTLGIDLLDPTKLVPEEKIPVRRVGRMVLNRNPENFFAETEQVAFHPGHLVPGIDFSNDPLLQGRLFSYTDTQLSRLGGANFHELPVNRSQCPMHNFQRDGRHRQDINSGRVAYEPNTLDNGDEFRVDGRTFEPVGRTGFGCHSEAMESPKCRDRSASFEDHFSQARLFWISQSRHEKAHLVAAFQFELSRLGHPDIRQRMVDLLAWVDLELAEQVAARLGIGPPDRGRAAAWPGFRDEPPVAGLPKPSPTLSIWPSQSMGIATRTVAILVSEGAHAASVQSMRSALAAERASSTLVAPALGDLRASDGSLLQPQATLDNTSSLMFDGVYLPAVSMGSGDLCRHPMASRFVAEAYRHGKTLAASGAGTQLLSLGTGLLRPSGGWSCLSTRGVVAGDADVLSDLFTAAFVAGLAQHRHWERAQCHTG